MRLSDWLKYVEEVEKGKEPEKSATEAVASDSAEPVATLEAEPTPIEPAPVEPPKPVPQQPVRPAASSEPTLFASAPTPDLKVPPIEDFLPHLGDPGKAPTEETTVKPQKPEAEQPAAASAPEAPKPAEPTRPVVQPEPRPKPAADNNGGQAATKELFPDRPAAQAPKQTPPTPAAKPTTGRFEVDDDVQAAEDSQEQASLQLQLLPKHIQALAKMDAREVAQNSYKRSFKESRDNLLERLLDPTLSLEDAARILNVCPTTVRRYTNRGVLPHHRTVGNQRRFRLSDIIVFMESQRRSDRRSKSGPEEAGDSEFDQ